MANENHADCGRYYRINLHHSCEYGKHKHRNQPNNDSRAEYVGNIKLFLRMLGVMKLPEDWPFMKKTIQLIGNKIVCYKEPRKLHPARHDEGRIEGSPRQIGAKRQGQTSR